MNERVAVHRWMREPEPRRWAGGAGSRSFAWFRYRVATDTYERLPDETGMPDRVAANGWVLGTATEPRIFGGGGVTELPRYKNGTEYQMASYSDDGLIAGGHMTGVGNIQNQPLMWKCRSTG